MPIEKKCNGKHNKDHDIPFLICCCVLYNVNE